MKIYLMSKLSTDALPIPLWLEDLVLANLEMPRTRPHPEGEALQEMLEFCCQKLGVDAQAVVESVAAATRKTVAVVSTDCMAEGYWTKAVKRMFPGAESVREDWTARTITFELFKAESALEFEMPHVLTQFGNEARASVCVRSDSFTPRHVGPGVMAIITIMNVRFPGRPG